MAFLYLTEQGASLRKTGDRLIVEKDGARLAEIECLHLDALLVFGNVQFTTQALAELLEHGIEMALLSQDGRLKGQLTPPKARNVLLRMEQYQTYNDPARRLAFARAVVAAKLANAAAVVSRHRANHPADELARAQADIESLSARAASAASLEELLGVEGAAARAYFAAFAAMGGAALGFRGRSSRPPRDPANALLSFGYTLLGNELLWLADAMGFDPHIGLYHSLDYGRPSLALDLLEQFRHPAIDRLTLNLINRRVLGEQDFDPPRADGGVRLKRDSLKRYLAEYDRWMRAPLRDPETGQTTDWRGLLRRQGEKLAAALTRGEPYRGFVLPERSG